MSLVRLPKLIREINTSYMMIIVVNEARNTQFLCVIAPKDPPYDTPVCRGLCRTFPNLLSEILCLIYCMDITQAKNNIIILLS